MGIAHSKLPEEKTMAEAQAAPERKVEQVNRTHIEGYEYKSTVHALEVPQGTQPEDLLATAYWAGITSQLKAWDEIVARTVDGTWYMRLLVLDVSRAWARVKPIIGPIHLSTADVSQTQAKAEYEVMWRGPRKFSVVRVSDRKVMHDGEELKLGAEQWLKDNAGKLKAEA